jgi:hypothetical protein
MGCVGIKLFITTVQLYFDCTISFLLNSYHVYFELKLIVQVCIMSQFIKRCDPVTCYILTLCSVEFSFINLLTVIQMKASRYNWIALIPTLLLLYWTPSKHIIWAQSQAHGDTRSSVVINILIRTNNQPLAKFSALLNSNDETRIRPVYCWWALI